MVKRFCASCGTTIESGSFCVDCKPTADITYKDVKVRLCPPTKEFCVHNKWKKYQSVNQAIEETVLAQLKTPGIVKRVEVTTPAKAIATVQSGKKYADIPVAIIEEVRPGLKSGQYFEGSLQLRNTSPEIIARTHKLLSKIYISKVVEHKNGTDLFVSSIKIMQRAATQLVKEFSGQMQQSPQLFTRNKQTSKDVFRVNVLVTFPLLKKGNVLLYRQTPYLVISMGKQVKVRSLCDDSITRIDLPKKLTVLEKKKTKVTRTLPRLEVIHPETFVSEPVRNNKSLRVNQNVQVVDYDGLWVI